MSILNELLTGGTGSLSSGLCYQSDNVLMFSNRNVGSGL